MMSFGHLSVTLSKAVHAKKCVGNCHILLVQPQYRGWNKGNPHH